MKFFNDEIIPAIWYVLIDLGTEAFQIQEDIIIVHLGT